MWKRVVREPRRQGGGCECPVLLCLDFVRSRRCHLPPRHDTHPSIIDNGPTRAIGLLHVDVHSFTAFTRSSLSQDTAVQYSGVSSKDIMPAMRACPRKSHAHSHTQSNPRASTALPSHAPQPRAREVNAPRLFCSLPSSLSHHVMAPRPPHSVPARRRRRPLRPLSGSQVRPRGRPPTPRVTCAPRGCSSCSRASPPPHRRRHSGSGAPPC